MPGVSLPTVTLHLLSVGDVIDVDDEDFVHEVARRHSAAITNGRARTARCGSAIRLPIEFAASEAAELTHTDQLARTPLPFFAHSRSPTGREIRGIRSVLSPSAGPI